MTFAGLNTEQTEGRFAIFKVGNTSSASKFDNEILI